MTFPQKLSNTFIGFFEKLPCPFSTESFKAIKGVILLCKRQFAGSFITETPYLLLQMGQNIFASAGCEIAGSVAGFHAVGLWCLSTDHQQSIY